MNIITISLEKNFTKRERDTCQSGFTIIGPGIFALGAKDAHYMVCQIFLIIDIYIQGGPKKSL